MQHHLRILDNSFKSAYCYIYKIHDGKQRFQEELLLLEKTKKKEWNQILEIGEKKLPGIEGAITVIDTPFSILEFIGLGTLRKNIWKQYKREFEQCFPDNNELAKKLAETKTIEEWIIAIDTLACEALDKLEQLYRLHIDIKDLQEKAAQKKKNIHCHPHTEVYLSASTDSRINELITHGKEGREFAELVELLVWDTFTRHICSNMPAYEKKSLLRFIGWYQDLKKNHPGHENLAGTVLLTSLSAGKLLFEDHIELVDPELIEYAYTGFFYNGERKPVIIFSADKNGTNNRLDHFIREAYRCNRRLPLGKQLICMPGYLILVPQDQNNISESSVELICVRERIKSIHKEFEVASNKQ